MTTFATADGLRYAVDDTDIHYEPAGTFYVDGICYAHPGCHVRWMAEIIRPHKCYSDKCTAGARMGFSTPLTDAEVDRWVHTGYVAYGGISINSGGVLW